MPQQGLLACGARELPTNREPPADDVVGNAEQLHRRAQILRLKAEAAGAAFAETQRELLAIGQSAIQPRGLPDPAAAQQLGGNLADFLTRAENQPVDARGDRERYRRWSARIARRVLDQASAIDP